MENKELINPITIDEKKSPSSGFNFNYFVDNKVTLSEEPLAKKPQTKKKIKKMINGDEFISEEPVNTLPAHQSNEPYMNSYDETNNMLKSSIVQIDMMNNSITSELESIRASKTLKKKYDYIATLSQTASSLIGTKVTAIREMNKTISDCHNLELKRIKDLNLATSEVDDEKKIMDMYNAFISTPMSSNALGLNTSDITFNSSNLLGKAITQDPDAGFNNYLANLTPAQNAMRHESNSETVVVYDYATGGRWFDTIDSRTGEKITNVPVKDSMFLEDTTLDLKNLIARNNNLNETYKIVVINKDSALKEY